MSGSWCRLESCLRWATPDGSVALSLLQLLNWNWSLSFTCRERSANSEEGTPEVNSPPERQGWHSFAVATPWRLARVAHGIWVRSSHSSVTLSPIESRVLLIKKKPNTRHIWSVVSHSHRNNLVFRWSRRKQSLENQYIFFSDKINISIVYHKY